MFRLIAVLYVLIATTLAGVAVTAVLALNMFDSAHIAGAAAVGALVALPVSWFVGKRLFTAMKSV